MSRISDCNASVPENIKRIITEKGYLQKAIAFKANLTNQQLCDILNGRKLLKPCDILAIAGALHVTPNDLFGLGDDET